MLAGKDLSFGEWTDWFLERRSKSPYRAEKIYLANRLAVAVAPEHLPEEKQRRLLSAKLCVVFRTRFSEGSLCPAMTMEWWARRDSNPGPLPCEGSALTN